MSADELGKLVGTSHQQILRLEDGTRKLTLDWMTKIAAALGVTTADLLSVRAMLEYHDDVEPENGAALAEVSVALKKKGLHLYRVTSDALSGIGITQGRIITVDETAEVAQNRATGDAVLVRLGQTVDKTYLVLRQFIAPALLVTNRTGTNTVLRIDDTSLSVTVQGVVVRD